MTLIDEPRAPGRWRLIKARGAGRRRRRGGLTQRGCARAESGTYRSRPSLRAVGYRPAAPRPGRRQGGVRVQTVVSSLSVEISASAEEKRARAAAIYASALPVLLTLLRSCRRSGSAVTVSLLHLTSLYGTRRPSVRGLHHVAEAREANAALAAARTRTRASEKNPKSIQKNSARSAAPQDASEGGREETQSCSGAPEKTGLSATVTGVRAGWESCEVWGG